MKVSVIVPVFRVPGGLLEACLESLEGQTARDLEILCVLDGPDEAARELLEKLLHMLAEEGEEACFEYIRKKILWNRPSTRLACFLAHRKE